MAVKADTPTATDMFAEVEIPAVTRIGTTRFVNPFMDVVKSRKGNPKALVFRLENITDDNDENETMEKVTKRARRMLTDAGDAATDEKNPNGVTVRMVDNQDGTVTFWVLNTKIEKKAKGEAAPATTEVVSD